MSTRSESNPKAHYQHIVDIIDDHVVSAGKIFSYCMTDGGLVSIAVYSDEGDHLLWHLMLDELADAVRDAWHAEPENKRWEYFELVINDADFIFDFTYPEEIDREETWSEREVRLLKKQLGQKPIDYGSSEGWI